MKGMKKAAIMILALIFLPLMVFSSPVTVNTSAVVNTNTCDTITWSDSSGLQRTASIVKINGNPQGYKGGYFSRLTYMDGAATVNINESNPAGDLSGLGFMVNHQPTGYAGRGWANSKQDGFNGTTTILFQGANHVIYQTEMDMYGDNGNTAKGAWKVKWVYMIRTGSDYIVDSIAYDFSSKPFGTYGNDIRSPYCEVNWTGTGAANTLSESIDGIEFCAANNSGASYIFKTNGSSPFSAGYTYNTAGRNIPYTLQWKNTPDREAGYVSTLDLTQQAAGGGYLSGPVNIGSTSASMPPNWAVNYQSNGFQGWMGDKMTWGLPYGAAGGETAAESGSTTKSTFPDWTWRKNWSAYPTIGFTLLIHMGKKTEDKVRALVAEQADIHTLPNTALTAATGTVVTSGNMNLYDAGGFTFKPAGFNHNFNAWEVVCASDAADITLSLGSVSLKNQTFIFDNYNSALVPQITLNSAVQSEGTDVYTSVDTVNKKLYVTFNEVMTGANHIVITSGGPAATFTNTPSPTPTVPVGSGDDCINLTIDRSQVPSKVFMNKLTLKVHVGDCSNVTVYVDSIQVPSVYNASTKICMFSAEGTDVQIVRTNYTGGATNAVAKATLYNDKKWAYSFTFDDGRPNTRLIALPVLEAKGYRAGVGLNTQSMGPTADGYVMSWASADILRAKGWSFFDHNYSHQAVTCANISTETVPVINSVDARWSDYKCTHFVYPYVNISEWTCIRDSGLLLSAENFTGNNYADVMPANTFLLNRNGFMGTTDAASYNAMADNAASDSRNRWLIYFTHNVEAGSTVPGTYDTNETVFSTHINYIYNTYGAGGLDNMWFAPSDEVMQYILTREKANVTFVGSGTCGAIITATPTFTFTASNTPVVTPTSSAVCSFDDLDDGDNGNVYGGYWYTYASGNPSLPSETYIWPAAGAATCPPSAGGANSSAYAMRMTGTVGAIVAAGNIYPCIGIGSQLSATSGTPSFSETDISSCTGMKFYTKGDGKSYYVKVAYTNSSGATLTGYDDYKFVFNAPASWTQLTIPFTSFAQAGWGTAADLTTVLTHAKEIQWQTNFNGATGVPAAVDLWIDSVELYGCNTCPSAGVPTATFTATMTPPAGATSTFTYTNTSAATHTATLTYTFTATITNTYTQTNTPPPGSTPTFTYTNTSTPAATATFTQTNTALPGSTSTFTFTATSTAIATSTFSRTNTPLPVSTSTFTFTATNTATATFTKTNTPLMAATATFTSTGTATDTFTPVNTATYTQTPLPSATSVPLDSKEQTISDVMTYPNPCNPATGKLRIQYTLTKRAKSVNLRIYSASYRLVREINIGKNVFAGAHTQEVIGNELKQLASGTYYYYVTDNETRSKASMFMIIK